MSTSRSVTSNRRSTSLRAATLCVLLISATWGRPLIARGGHGMGGFGTHGHAGGGEGFLRLRMS
jgi:hypothetical protein